MVASTAGIATGQPITFSFNSLPLTYGNDYGAVFVNVAGDGSLTPVLVSALTANYVDQGGGDFHPQPNYGTEQQFQYATSNFITTNQFGQFFNAYSYAGDANFSAALDTVPEPASLLMLAVGIGTAALRMRRRRDAEE
jgi:hypothetical protein